MEFCIFKYSHFVPSSLSAGLAWQLLGGPGRVISGLIVIGKKQITLVFRQPRHHCETDMFLPLRYQTLFYKTVNIIMSYKLVMFFLF